MAMTDDRLRILRMVEKGQISAEEGARLLDAITDG
jgi:polyhydroxyalkanoate synthesis regulator phasin